MTGSLLCHVQLNLFSFFFPIHSEQRQPLTLSQRWTNLIKAIRAPVHRCILWLSDHAAAHPKAYIVGIILISVILVVTGLFTNFSVDVDEDTLWTPKNSRPLSHGEWIQSTESGFDKEPRSFLGLIHRTGDNVLGMDGVRRTFDAVDVLRNTEGYNELCATANHEDFNGIQTCQVIGVTNFWNDTELVFEASVSTDDEAIVSMSTPYYPNGAPVDLKLIFGKPVVGMDAILESAEAYTFIINLPAEDDDAAAEVEKKAIDALLEMQDAWAVEEGNDFVLQVFADRSFSDEFQRAIVDDIPLVPIVFVRTCYYELLCLLKRPTPIIISHMLLVITFITGHYERLYLPCILAQRLGVLANTVGSGSCLHGLSRHHVWIRNLVYCWSSLHVHDPDSSIHHVW